jgi:hypothetical protein
MSMPIAAIETLASLISASSVSTVQELFSLLEGAAEELKKASFNPISLASGTQLLLRFLTIQRLSPDQSFDEFKAELVKRAREFVEGSGRCRDIIAAHITTFVKDDSVSRLHRCFVINRHYELTCVSWAQTRPQTILVHSYSVRRACGRHRPPHHTSHRS